MRGVRAPQVLCRASTAQTLSLPLRRYSSAPSPFDAKDFKFRRAKDADRPLVLMFGWLGAREKYLKKYVEWYRDHQYSTVAYIPPLRSVLFPGSSQKRGDDMALALRDFSMQNPATSIIFHAFSGNGLHFYGQVQKGLRQHKIELPNVRGIILDSPPYKITPEQFISGFAGSVELPSLLRPVNRALWSAFFRVYLSEARIQQFKEMEHELIHHPPPIPQLVMFSDADEITPVADLPEYLSIQRSRGLNVRAINFKTSAHVQHMRYFPERYWEEVSTFITSCTTNKTDGAGRASSS